MIGKSQKKRVLTMPNKLITEDFIERAKIIRLETFQPWSTNRGEI